MKESAISITGYQYECKCIINGTQSMDKKFVESHEKRCNDTTGQYKCNIYDSKDSKSIERHLHASQWNTNYCNKERLSNELSNEWGEFLDKNFKCPNGHKAEIIITTNWEDPDEVDVKCTEGDCRYNTSVYIRGVLTN